MDRPAQVGSHQQHPSAGVARSEAMGQTSADPAVTYWTQLADSPELTRRRHVRTSVEATRSLALQHLDGDDQPISSWCSADILDISLGGLCLLVMQSFPLPDHEASRIRLDVRSQPGFGVENLAGQIRWFVQSGLVLTLGVGFDQPLERLPALLACRRATPRDLEPDVLESDRD
jgi:hypothetical protein